MSTPTVPLPADPPGQIALVMATLQAVVDEAGHDYRYTMRMGGMNNGGKACFYVHEGEPDCIVGRVLHRLGVPLDVLRANDLAGNLSVSAGAFSLEGSPVQPGREALTILATAQRLQDQGNTWGECLRVAQADAQKVYGWRA